MKKSNLVQGNNAFVKQGQNNMASMMGDRPGCPPAMKKFNAYMSNDGKAAEEAARKATAGLDKKAFPVK